MCLDKLRKFKIPVYGYKVFRIDRITLVGCHELFSVFQGEPKAYPINKILDEKFFRSGYHKKRNDLYNYPYGFHIYQTLKSAKKRWSNFLSNNLTHYAIYKVEIIEPHTTGLETLDDNYCHVIVSKKMRVLEDVSQYDKLPTIRFT